LRVRDNSQPVLSEQDLLVDPYMLTVVLNDHHTEESLNSFILKRNSIAEARTELARSGFSHGHGRRHGHGHGDLGRDSGMVLENEGVKLSSPRSFRNDRVHMHQS
jgi:hypothetical protein